MIGGTQAKKRNVGKRRRGGPEQEAVMSAREQSIQALTPAVPINMDEASRVLVEPSQHGPLSQRLSGFSEYTPIKIRARTVRSADANVERDQSRG
jgi:hypothetical protein